MSSYGFPSPLCWAAWKQPAGCRLYMCTSASMLRHKALACGVVLPCYGFNLCYFIGPLSTSLLQIQSLPLAGWLYGWYCCVFVALLLAKEPVVSYLYPSAKSSPTQSRVMHVHWLIWSWAKVYVHHMAVVSTTNQQAAACSGQQHVPCSSKCVNCWYEVFKYGLSWRVLIASKCEVSGV